MKRLFVLLLVFPLLISTAQGQLPPPGPRQEIKQLVPFDQGNAIALLAGVDSGTGKPTFFSVYFYNNRGELISIRATAKRDGEIEEIAITGQAAETRLFALVNTKKS